MSSSDDLPGDPQQDIERLKDMSRGGMDTSPDAIAEGVLSVLFGLVAIGWLVAIWWVPDTIAGEVWLGAGIVGGIVFGVPLAAIMALRRGGVSQLARALREV